MKYFLYSHCTLPINSDVVLYASKDFGKVLDRRAELALELVVGEGCFATDVTTLPCRKGTKLTNILRG